MNHFVYVVSRCRWHFPIESGSEAATYNRRVYELSCRHNTVSRYVGFLFLFKNIFNYKLSRVGKKVKIYLDITKLRWVCDETYLQDKGVPYHVLFTRLHFFIQPRQSGVSKYASLACWLPNRKVEQYEVSFPFNFFGMHFICSFLFVFVLCFFSGGWRWVGVSSPELKAQVSFSDRNLSAVDVVSLLS